MTELQALMVSINARSAAYLDKQARRAIAVNKAATLILCLAAVGLWYAAGSAADHQFEKQDRINQEQTVWKR